ncbi:MAG: ABC transporter ATP-binding protein [Thermoanaerobaculia bacterium]
MSKKHEQHREAEARELSVSVENLSKYYRIRTGRDRSSSSAGGANSRFDPRLGFAALKDVSFEVRPGVALALVGQNGAGKTTLLRVLAGVVAPSSGRVSVRGRTSSLLGLRAGLNPRLTGRENIYLYGALLSFDTEFVNRHLGAIVAFAELGPFLDQPLASYSPGMASRLAFSTAVHLETDVLLLDEVLAVGDPSFQARALRRMKRYFEDGSTVIFCSHNLNAIESLCTKAVWLDEGRVREAGRADGVIERYRQFCGRRALSSHPLDSLETSASDEKHRLETLDDLGHSRNRFAVDEGVVARFSYDRGSFGGEQELRVILFDPIMGRPVFALKAPDNEFSDRLLPERATLICTVEPNQLRPRQYWFEIERLAEGSGDPAELLARAPLLVFDPSEAEESERDRLPDPASVSVAWTSEH